MWDLNCVCDLHHSSRQHCILNPLSKARDRTGILMDTSWIRFHWATTGTPLSFFYLEVISEIYVLCLFFRLNNNFSYFSSCGIFSISFLCPLHLSSLPFFFFFLFFFLTHNTNYRSVSVCLSASSFSRLSLSLCLSLLLLKGGLSLNLMTSVCLNAKPNLILDFLVSLAFIPGLAGPIFLPFEWCNV